MMRRPFEFFAGGAGQGWIQRGVGAGLVALIAAATIMAGDVNGEAQLSAVQREVFARERAFAQTMADRDIEAFRTFISDDAVFFDGSRPLRGRSQVVEAWRSLFTGDQAPFSWEPDQVEVLDSGDLALSTGLVLNPKGEYAGRFLTIWRLESGDWKVVFDKGSD